MYDQNNYAHRKKYPYQATVACTCLGGNKRRIWLHISCRGKYQNKLVATAVVLKTNMTSKCETVILTWTLWGRILHISVQNDITI